MSLTPTLLLILDGYGLAPAGPGNAASLARTPNIDRLISLPGATRIDASGRAVGLPAGYMGNSEVGHLNIGAGRIVYQDMTRIDVAMETGELASNAALLELLANVKRTGGRLHFAGLLSDGGVHSHINHFLALVEMAKQQGLQKVYLHCFMDGRDVPPTSGKGFIEQVQKKLAELGVGKIATIIGRYYAMDRDNRWERVEQAYNAMVLGEGNRGTDPVAMVQKSYDDGDTDEFIKPIVITENEAPVATIQAGDSVIFANFRPDRAREITRSLIFEDFDGFERKNGYFPLQYVSMTQYDATFADKLEVAFKPESLKNTLGEYLASQHKTQLRIAETEKYAHVTFFFNGGVEKENPGEDRALIPSPKVATYDLKPEMSAYEVADEAVKRIESGKYDVMILNFANPDMVGHTGVMEAAIKAVEAVDECAGKVIDAVLATSGCVLLTADHGNAEKMIDENGGPMTAHSTSPVPLLLADPAHPERKLADGGALCDLAPTMLALMNLPQPAEMTGKSLLV